MEQGYVLGMGDSSPTVQRRLMTLVCPEEQKRSYEADA